MFSEQQLLEETTKEIYNKLQESDDSKAVVSALLADLYVKFEKLSENKAKG